MTEAQEKALKRLNILYMKLYTEEDYKAALSVQMQIIAFENQVSIINEGQKAKLLSPLN